MLLVEFKDPPQIVLSVKNVIFCVTLATPLPPPIRHRHPTGACGVPHLRLHGGGSMRRSHEDVLGLRSSCEGPDAGRLLRREADGLGRPRAAKPTLDLRARER